MSRTADGLADDRLAHALHPYLRGEGAVLLAVSGGPDSTALLHAVARLRVGAGTANARARVEVATVDHRLRPDAAREAEAVGDLAGRLGLPHRVLVWESPCRRGVQEAARTARYRLLGDHAVAIGAGTVLTAHTRDDQAETVLMRLMAGSGPAGLSGMARERPLRDGIRLARPFLDLTKADLVAYCAAHGLPSSRDPSNADVRFARARLRALMPPLAAEGLSAGRLCRLARRLARDEAALAGQAADLLAAARIPSEPGTLMLDGRQLLCAPEAVALRALDRALEFPEPSRGPHRLERLERLLDALLPALAAGLTLRRTLRGRLIEATASGAVVLRAEPARRGARGAAPVGLVAGACDLLGKGEGAAYIGAECPE